MVIFLETNIHVISKSMYECFDHYFTVDKYSWLVDGTAQAQVDKFIDEEHSFEEYNKVTNRSLNII